MTFFKKLILAGFIVSSLSTAGVFAEGNPINNGYKIPFNERERIPEQRTNDIGMNEVVFVDHDLNRTFTKKRFLFWGKKKEKTVKVSVNKQGIRPTAGGTAEVWVEFRNHTDFPVQIEGRTSFYFSDNSPAEPEPHWQKVFIPANSVTTYKEQSWDSSVGYYRVEVKEATE